MSDTALKDEDEELTFQDAIDAFNASIPVHELGYAMRAYIRLGKNIDQAAEAVGVTYGRFKVDLRRDYGVCQKAVNRGLSLWGT